MISRWSKENDVTCTFNEGLPNFVLGAFACFSYRVHVEVVSNLGSFNLKKDCLQMSLSKEATQMKLQQLDEMARITNRRDQGQLSLHKFMYFLQKSPCVNVYWYTIYVPNVHYYIFICIMFNIFTFHLLEKLSRSLGAKKIIAHIYIKMTMLEFTGMVFARMMYSFIHLLEM